MRGGRDWVGRVWNNLMVFDYGCEGEMDEWARLMGNEEWRWEKCEEED